MRRRKFITLSACAAAAWSLAARAQQSVRRIGVLVAAYTQTDREGQVRIAALLDTLQRLGWADGRTVHIEYRWAGGDADRGKSFATELVRSTPDVMVLKEVAPRMNRIAVIYGSDSRATVALLRAVEAVAPALAVEVTAVDLHHGVEIEHTIAEFASQPNGGLIVTPYPGGIANRASIIVLAARHRLPAVYPFRYFATEGGLMSYGPDQIEQWRGAATYVDRILRGEKPGDLPVQAPTKFELVVNMKTAKVLDIHVPTTLSARADEVIE